MSNKVTRIIVAILLVAMALSLFGCGGATTPAPAEQPKATEAPKAVEQPKATEAPKAEKPAAGGKITVGLSFSDFATERWKGEQVLMQKLLEEKGYNVIWQEANHDVKLQNDQIDNMVTQGAKALIVIAEDGDAAATAVDKAAKAGVKVIAYDRLIKSTNIGAYISFNNTEVGRQEALGVMKALNFDGGKWTKDNPAKVMMMGGSPTDNNAILVRNGQMEVVQPYIDKGLVKIVADQWVDNWDPANALKIMENVLTAQNNKIDAVVASNDGTALGALQALKAQKLAGIVPISGQDATADGCNSIVKGEQTVSVYKDTRLLSPLAVELADKFLKGQTDPNLKNYTMAELTNDKSKTGEVPCEFLPVQQVTKDNVDELIVKSGFQKAEDVYRDVQAPAAGGEKITVGLSFSDFATERWKGEQVLMQKLLEEKGYNVIWQEANHDVKLQNDQIDNMVTQGAKALIVIAEDGDAAATAVDKAAAAGVKVIAYDRLIKSTNIGAYISFNNTEVGRQEALGVMKALNFDGGKWTKDNPAKVMMMGGSPTDNNAILVRQGQMEVVQPYIDKGLVKIVADQWVDNWDPANALKIMENVLTAQNNKIDAVVASNDGTALGALQALKAQKLAGIVPISGQDATADGCNSIVKGEQTVSVYKDTRLLSPLAVELADKFLKGQTDPNLKNYTMAELTNDKSKTGEVPCEFLPVQQVTKDNVDELIVKSGFQKAEDVYRDVQAPAAGGEKITVGLSFSDFATERWKGEQVLMQKLLEEKGYNVIWQEANHDVKLQNDQIDNMVTQGAKALIVIAEDGDAAATAVDKAAAAGVKVIAYDRLIKSPNIGAYISFNNTEVGRQEALGVVKALNFDGGKWTKDNPAKVMMMGGSPTDNNAILVRQGQMEVVQPYIDKGLFKIVADQWVDNWDPANALKIMENVLTAQNNKIDAVVASNDGTALGALQALKAQKLAGIVPISGQDATADGCNSIVKGEQTVSVYKDTRLLSPLAVELADKFLKGQTDPNLKNYTMAELTNDKSKTGEVPCEFLPVVQVTKDNVYDLIVKSGFQKYDDVYRDIPADQLPPKPGEAAAAPAAGGEKITVGLSFSDFATERWKGEQVLMQKLLEEKGYNVIWQEANHDVKLQNDQIDNMVTQGAKALIVIAEDGDAAATAVDKAAAAGVKVIAYDRLIKSPNIGAYISFNNTEVGRQEALGVVKALNFDGGKWTKDNPAKVMMMGGSPTDNNAILVRQGQMEVVQPYIDKGLFKIVADQWVDNWDPANALKIMENVLTAQNNKIDAVVASNDGTALGALQALKAQKLAGIVPISGQDATADGCNSIVKGEQTVSVYKDTRLLSPLAVDLADKFLKGQTDPNLKNYTMAELTNDKSKTGEVPCEFLPVVQVTKDNVYDLIVKSGFQKYDDVYRDIPADQLPPKP